MKSRIAGIKKINILRWVVITNFLLFVGAVLLSIFVLKAPYLWFVFFCFFVGCYLLEKAHLYNADSNFYLGSVLLILGCLFVANFFLNFSSTFYLICFSFIGGSLLTFLKYRQRFHLFVAMILLLVCLDFLLYRRNIINIYIFFGLIALIIFIFSFVYVKMKLRKKS